MVGREAARLLPAFKDKMTHAKELVVHHFTKSVGLTQCSATHTAQKHYTETEAAGKDFIAMAKIKLQGRNLDDILNMDQMPIPYSYHLNKTLDTKGKNMPEPRRWTQSMSPLLPPSLQVGKC